MKKVRYKEFLVGVCLALVLTYPWSSFLEKTPYTDVEVTHVVPTEDGVIVIANFVKKTCTFKRLEVFGTDLGQVYRLDWENVESTPELDYGTTHDRVAGVHTLRILIKTEGAPFDSFEIRTRHSCAGTDVDRVFVKVEAPDDTNT